MASSRGRLRIAYQGNFTHPFCTERHVEQALRSLGHSVIRIQESQFRWTHVRRLLNRSRIDMLLWTRTWDIDHEAAAEMLDWFHSRDKPTVSFHLDRWWGLDREYQIESEPFFRTQTVFTADGGNDERWRAAGVNHRWLPPGVSGFDCAPIAPSPKAWPHPVVFVGSHPYPHKEWEPYRTKMLDVVRGVVGDDLAILPGIEPVSGKRRPAIRQQALRTLYATAKMAVGDSCLVGNPSRYWSDRIPETLGRGCFLIHPWVDGIDEWYTDGEHLVLYPQGDWDELAKLVRWWLDHDTERQRVAAAGRELVLGRDTYTHRMETLLEEVFDR